MNKETLNEEFSYDQSIEKLEEIVLKIEQKTMSVDELVINIKTANDIVHKCKNVLRAIEKDIDDIL